MDILAVRPELKEILGHTGTEESFKSLLSDMNSAELIALDHYLNKALDQSAHNVWSKQRDVRKVEKKIQILKQDYKTLRGKLELIQKDLKTSFKTIYRAPNKAEKKCVEWEKIKGLIKTGWTIRNKPIVFGGLRGLSLLGLFQTNARKRAKKTAKELNYEQMKKSFNDGKKIATWLSHILKGT